MLARDDGGGKHEVMRGLKALVIGLGALILIGMGVVVVTVANRLADKAAPSPAQGLAAAPAAPAFGRAEIAVPKGARVVETAVSGGRRVVRLELANGATRLLVLDPETGRAAGAVDLVPSE
jgi:hypothetical protein